MHEKNSAICICHGLGRWMCTWKHPYTFLIRIVSTLGNMRLAMWQKDEEQAESRIRTWYRNPHQHRLTILLTPWVPRTLQPSSRARFTGATTATSSAEPSSLLLHTSWNAQATLSAARRDVTPRRRLQTPLWTATAKAARKRRARSSDGAARSTWHPPMRQSLSY